MNIPLFWVIPKKEIRKPLASSACLPRSLSPSLSLFCRPTGDFFRFAFPDFSGFFFLVISSKREREKICSRSCFLQLSSPFSSLIRQTPATVKQKLRTLCRFFFLRFCSSSTHFPHFCLRFVCRRCACGPLRLSRLMRGCQVTFNPATALVLLCQKPFFSVHSIWPILSHALELSISGHCHSTSRARDSGKSDDDGEYEQDGEETTPEGSRSRMMTLLSCLDRGVHDDGPVKVAYASPSSPSVFVWL